MEYNIESRLFLKNNAELLSFRSVLLDYLNNLKIRKENNEIKIVENKFQKMLEFEQFILNLEEIELLENIESEFPEEQEVYENDPIEFKNNLCKLDIYLVKKADANFMLNINFNIKDKFLSRILLRDLILSLSKNDSDLKTQISQSFKEDFKLYFRFDKIQFLNKKIVLFYGNDVVWIKIKPFVFVKDYLRVKEDVVIDLLS